MVEVGKRDRERELEVGKIDELKRVEVRKFKPFSGLLSFHFLELPGMPGSSSKICGLALCSVLVIVLGQVS